MGKKLNGIKKEAKGILDGFFCRLTPTGVMIFAGIITAIILVVFLATTVGRGIIVFSGYAGFVLGTLYLGYRIYKYGLTNAREKTMPDDDPGIENEK